MKKHGRRPNRGLRRRPNRVVKTFPNANPHKDAEALQRLRAGGSPRNLRVLAIAGPPTPLEVRGNRNRATGKVAKPSRLAASEARPATEYRAARRNRDREGGALSLRPNSGHAPRKLPAPKPWKWQRATPRAAEA